MTTVNDIYKEIQNEINRIPQLDRFFKLHQMNTALYVPVNVNALRLEDSVVPVDTAEAMIEFSKLPKNAGDAHISKDMIASPFEKPSGLGSGTHIHWTLPEALTRGKEVKDKVTKESKLQFPIVPNRWLVIKKDGQGIASKWMVESDYIHPSGAPLPDKNKILLGPTYPVSWEGETGGYCRLGRAIMLKEYHGAPDINYNLLEQGDYLINKKGHELTSVGYGNPHFTSFFPNCENIFGIKEISQRSNGDEFHIFGWYSNIEKDFYRNFIGDFSEVANEKNKLLNFYRDPNYTGPRTKSLFDEMKRNRLGLYKKVSDQLGWKIQESDLFSMTLSWNTSVRMDVPRLIPSMMFCYGNVKISESAAINELPKQLRVSLGSSLQQAIAVHKGIDGNEDTIKNLQNEHYQDDIQGMELDVKFKLEEAHHNSTFKTINGGLLWRIISRTKNNSEQYASVNHVKEHSEITLPNELAASLSKLNKKQNGLNKSTFEIHSLQNNLYKDWYRYNISKTTPEHITHISKEGIQEMIERESLPEIKQKLILHQALIKEQNDIKTELDFQLNEFNSQNNGSVHLVLEKAAAPRYYGPANPAIVFGEPPTKRHAIDSSESLTCFSEHYYKPVIEGAIGQNIKREIDGRDIEGIHFNNEDSNIYFGTSFWGSAHNIVNNTNIPIYTEAKNPWNPILMDWEIDYEEKKTKAIGPKSEYSNRFILDHFRFEKDQVDLRDIRLSADRVAIQFKGRSMLFPNKSATDIISSTFENFMESRIMHLYDFQLPLSLSKEEPLGKKIIPYLDMSAGYSAPLLDSSNGFSPIITGAIKIKRFIFVDSFGFTTHLENNVLIAPYALEEGAKDKLYLPPRIVQPARLDFRWLSGQGSFEEMNSHPASSPVMGWIVPNFFENTLTVFNHLGDVLGNINVADGKWLQVPGVEITVDEISNPHLRKVVRYIIAQNIDFRKDFMLLTEEALRNIEPENYAHHTEMSFLMGTPLAVVRASVNLELQGLPEYYQAWSAFKNGIKEKITKEFTKVKFPIKIGEYKQANDGLVGFWLEGKEGNLDKYYAPHNQPKALSLNSPIITEDTDLCFVEQSIDSPKSYLTMLLDIKGSVHASSGILPTKSISIPEDQYKESLQKLSVLFKRSFVITPEDELTFNVPFDYDYKWDWLENIDGKWNERSIDQRVNKMLFTKEFGDESGNAIWIELMKQKWLVSESDDSSRAFIVPKNKRQNQSLDFKYNNVLDKIENLLNYAQNPSTLNANNFDKQQVVKDGWFRLAKRE